MSKVERLMAVRDRTIKSLQHRVTDISDFDESTARRKLTVSERILDTNWKLLTETLKELDGFTIDADTLKQMQEENLSVEDGYIEAKTMLGELTQLWEEKDSKNDTSTNETSYDSSIKLNRLTIKPFSGKHEDWSEFKDVFESCVVKNGKIPDIQKLQHLKNLLADEPALYIKNLKITSDNFEKAWKLLNDQYENKYKVVTSYLQKFFELPTISSGIVAAVDIRNMILVTKDMINSLPELGVDTSTWDAIVVHSLVQKLDLGTMNYWHEERKASKEVPSLSTFITFLETRQTISESKEARRRSMPVQLMASRAIVPKIMPKTPTSKSLLSKSFTITCEICGKDHRTFQCPKLINATVDQRLELVRAKKLCENCLYSHHDTAKCSSQFKCRSCNEHHHTLLHPQQLAMCTKIVNNDDSEFDESQEDGFEEEIAAALIHQSTQNSEDNVENETHVHLCKEPNDTTVPTRALLATALVPVYSKTGAVIVLRALLDQGSESSLITVRAQQLLNTERISEHIPVTAIGNTPAGIIKHSTFLTIGSLHDNKYRYGFKALVTKYITSINPQLMSQPVKWDHLMNLPLADPKYFEPGNIDLLLGVQEIAEIMLSGVKKGVENTPMAQLTKLGWVISGNHTIRLTKHMKCHLQQTITEDINLSELLKKFWAVEHFSDRPVLSPEERMAEQSFVESVHRRSDGKLCLRLPFNMDPNEDNFLGQSRQMAKSRFLQLERKFSKNETLRKEYTKCMHEYLELNHMRLATPTELLDSKHYVLPHHAVIKETSETTKVRVVFDASAKTSNGKSLNDRLCVGPTIQPDLFSILIQWRKGKIAFIGDIEKMYRQIWLVTRDTRYLIIFWRDSPLEPLRQYALQTVTFGTASAPFQAIRSLFHIADEVHSSDPELARAIKDNFYVDDFMRSEDTDEQATSMQSRLTQTMEKYGMNIRKWKSNSRSFLNTVDPNMQSDDVEHIFDTTCKALGLYWNPNRDQFHFKLELDQKGPATTKRRILSETAKLFDPLGWLAPCIIKAKILMQHLWLLPLGWDDTLPSNVSEEWNQIKEQLIRCSDIKIDRWVNWSHSIQTVTLHGFADASEAAYAAVVYMQVQTETDIHVSLLAAKTKVAPLKRKLVTVPELELSAALLLAELVTKVKTALNIANLVTTCWSDNKAVLDWIASPPHLWQTFVANRVAKIQDLVPPENWMHVPTKLNPADCATHGLFLDQLKDHPLWWNGPEYLRQSEDQWPPRHAHDSNQKLSRKRTKIHTMTTQENEILMRFSSLEQLIHVTAYCLRWKSRSETAFVSRTLSVTEIRNALNKWLRIIQSQYFASELEALRKDPDASLPKSSSIRSLAPYIDKIDGLLRVGGRLQEAKLSNDRKHPIILPSKCHLTRLIIQDAHMRTFHGGIQLTLQTTRQTYWIMQGRNTIKSYVHSCVICFRYRKQPMRQLMGNLPKFRVQETRPFTHTGVDFAGYFDIKTSSRRNAPFSKAYVAVFICLTTKAVHLEVVSALSTEAFLLAFRRFLSRKLIPAHMYSDRGTNFVGASNELPRLFQKATSEQAIEIRRFLLTQQIEWHMIPAHAPHFGGIWEASVKSVKTHLKRTLGNTRLNFEEFTTTIAQIESCLNSRPLYPLSEDPNDDSVVTPNHLLFGFAAAALPEPCSPNVPNERLSRYQLIQRLRNEFWSKWSNEYLDRQQKRPKWLKKEENVRENQVVLIKEDNMPPAQWLYGRITRVFPGKDSLIRVAEIKCKESILSRPIHKLCVLPIIDNSPTQSSN